MTTPLCDYCRARPATCRGAYDGETTPSLACDACCGHDNAGGWCKPLTTNERRQAATTPVVTPSQAAAALGRLGGLSRSPAKAAAARANGRLGGRPRKGVAG